MENRHKHFKELRDHLRANWTALFSAPISDSFRGTNHLGRYDSLSGVILEKPRTWSPHIEQVSRTTAQRMGLLGPPRRDLLQTFTIFSSVLLVAGRPDLSSSVTLSLT